MERAKNFHQQVVSSQEMTGDVSWTERDSLESNVEVSEICEVSVPREGYSPSRGGSHFLILTLVNRSAGADSERTVLLGLQSNIVLC